MADLNDFDFETGIDNPAIEVSFNRWNAFLEALENALEAAAGDTVNVLDHGLVEGDAGGANGLANSVAFEAILDELRTEAANVGDNYQGLKKIKFPVGYFEFENTIELTDGTLIIEGEDTGHASARGTKLKWPAGVTGIRVQRFDTSGHDTVDAEEHRGGDGPIIRNLALFGGYDDSTTEGEFHGIHLRARATITDFFIQWFEGDGIYSDTTASDGNSNNTRVFGGRIQNCRNGIFLNGPDSNIWSVMCVDTSGCREWGINDSSFLGNSYFGLHAATCGISKNGSPPSTVSYSGNRYGVLEGQAVGASTNAPSGTTDANTWWYFIGSGGVHEQFPAWVSGTTYRTGGSYRCNDSNARSVFVGCYHESGQGLPQIAAASVLLGGHSVAESNVGTAAGIFSESGLTASLRPFGYSRSTLEIQFGDSTSLSAVLLKDSVAAPNTWRFFRVNGFNLQADYQNSNSNRPWIILGPLTTDQLGKGTAAPYFFVSEKFAIGENLTNARQMTNGTAAPVSGFHGRGEIVWNRTPASGQPMGWVCGTAGEPGIWLPMANIP